MLIDQEIAGPNAAQGDRGVPKPVERCSRCRSASCPCAGAVRRMLTPLPACLVRLPLQVAKGAAAPRAARAGVVVRAAARGNWLPGSDFPAHLENSKLPGCYGFDPLGLGANEERLAWFAESERVHCRWAMLGVAGILLQVGAGPRRRGASQQGSHPLQHVNALQQ